MANTRQASKRSRVLSFTSNKSGRTHKSSGSGSKMDLTETHEEKEAKRMHTYADPTRAIQELQPSRYSLQKSNLESLRSIQHKDIYGNLITDPDLSNPTRHRFERPLDTIRSFEAAIDGSYMNRRASYVRGDESTNGGYSRRSSYFGDRGTAAGGPSHQNRGYNEQANYSTQPPSQSRPDSYVESNNGGGGGNYNEHNNNGYYGNYGSNGNNSNNGYQQRVPPHGGRRMNPDQQMQGHNSNSPVYHQSPGGQQYAQDENYSSEQMADYGEPSSAGGNMEDGMQYQQHRQQQGKGQGQAEQAETQAETYGFSGFASTPDLDYPPQVSSASNHGYYQGPVDGYNNGGSSQAFTTPNVSRNDASGAGGPGLNVGSSVMRKPVGVVASAQAAAAAPAAAPERKKSFFKRFSKS
ncbi:uncharacterized protein PADG_11717 [Paracoccidioides brasiliensis Pb18]|uniref:DUF2406 domain-containing protein n=1 Tax=Paracoccidioides brasiliensis (strain Pb18) TaxID=502780 RepID=A0A0A0HSK3_PARBD|nr:uncharacterized protein PADG_11717 [Paracoccidioides brasiliensis Pb18]KGM92179.1 hypothetical protein PADG_11717 [Paracoccidioides brasiliensis Pb18]